ncbi:MAG: hypothetical protein M5U28_27695 [Sandaracinaceae bacterium]|nr:hypothetical protein [Sandaracinaceae bacterium]
MLLDEPTAHLDTDNALTVVKLLAELRDEGTTVVAATHDPRLADDPRGRPRHRHARRKDRRTAARRRVSARPCAAAPEAPRTSRAC